MSEEVVTDLLFQSHIYNAQAFLQFSPTRSLYRAFNWIPVPDDLRVD
jgi:hypothetical protein